MESGKHFRPYFACGSMRSSGRRSRFLRILKPMISISLLCFYGPLCPFYFNNCDYLSSDDVGCGECHFVISPNGLLLAVHLDISRRKVRLRSRES